MPFARPRIAQGPQGLILSHASDFAEIFLFNFAGDVEAVKLYFKSVRFLELFLLPPTRRSILFFSANIKDAEGHIRNHASDIHEIFFSRLCWLSRDRKTLFQVRPIPRTLFITPHTPFNFDFLGQHQGCRGSYSQPRLGYS